MLVQIIKTPKSNNIYNILLQIGGVSNMKIISLNCNGTFRKKFSIIQKEDADIYVIQ